MGKEKSVKKQKIIITFYPSGKTMTYGFVRFWVVLQMRIEFFFGQKKPSNLVPISKSKIKTKF